MSRDLTDEEKELWQRLSQTVKPLPKRSTTTRRHEAPVAKTTSAKPPPGKQRQKTNATRVKASPPAQPPKAGPALAPLDDRTRRRLGRGLVEIDARIDLHGMRQERAFAHLLSFLRQAQAHGHRVVLVVTGKGSGDGSERGVLRQVVPAWLARPDHRHLVVGFEPAGRRHGGEGALYVRIRRRREARPARASNS